MPQWGKKIIKNKKYKIGVHCNKRTWHQLIVVSIYNYYGDIEVFDARGSIHWDETTYSSHRYLDKDVYNHSVLKIQRAIIIYNNAQHTYTRH